MKEPEPRNIKDVLILNKFIDIVIKEVVKKEKPVEDTWWELEGKIDKLHLGS